MILRFNLYEFYNKKILIYLDQCMISCELILFGLECLIFILLQKSFCKMNQYSRVLLRSPKNSMGIQWVVGKGELNKRKKKKDEPVLLMGWMDDAENEDSTKGVWWSLASTPTVFDSKVPISFDWTKTHLSHKHKNIPIFLRSYPIIARLQLPQWQWRPWWVTGLVSFLSYKSKSEMWTHF